jgi:hypothetical protein
VSFQKGDVFGDGLAIKLFLLETRKKDAGGKKIEKQMATDAAPAAEQSSVETMVRSALLFAVEKLGPEEVLSQVTSFAQPVHSQVQRVSDLEVQFTDKCTARVMEGCLRETPAKSGTFVTLLPACLEMHSHFVGVSVQMQPVEPNSQSGWISVKKGQRPPRPTG